MGGILSYQLEDDKEKKVTIDFEAFGPVNALLYPLHLVFQTEAPKELESDNKIGFIVTDGDVALLGTRSGNTLEVLHKFRSAGFKTHLCMLDLFDGRVRAKVLNTVDVPDGGEKGFNQAIELISAC
ncbi:hypothetical protein CDL15_Pgr009958 [Punica granatum]|uniref:Uncharacterized protein n=1 Tax=Punica granatum TaxID=22663 RepID=A0A218WWF2_PUNGR|nr:hypothetical protein CDL15_Pgr009958 [Punica granatum]